MSTGNCSWADVACHAGNAITGAVGDAIDNLAQSVTQAVGEVVASLGTVWVHIGTPNLTGSGGASPVPAGARAPGSEAGLTAVLGYVTWISLAVAIVSLIILGGLVAIRARRGEGVASLGRVGLVLAAVVLIGAAGALVGAVTPDGPVGGAGAVAFLQSSLWWYMGVAAVVSVVIGAARMAWEQRAEPGRDLLRSLMTLLVVAGAGVTIVSLLVAAADSFSVWILNNSLACDVTADGNCFGENITDLLALSGPNGLGPILVIILGLVAVIASVTQIVLMVARAGMLVILTGVLPLAASATNTEMGRGWFKKAVGWLVAFILYKPAAAIVYAAAFQLTGTDVFSDDGTGLLAVLTGLMLMLIALFAMPALMRFVTPMVGAVTSGAAAGGGALAGAVAVLPTGAAAVGRLAGGSTTPSLAAAAPGGANGISGGQGPTGSSAGFSGGLPSNGNTAASGARGSTDGSATAPSAGGGASARVPVATGSGAASAAGPLGAAATVATELGRGAASGVRAAGEQSTGGGIEGDGPSGSR